MILNYSLFGLLTALQLADVYTTRRILIAGGKELNPMMRWLIRKLGVMPGLIIPKAFLLILAYIVLLPYPWVLGALCGLYVGVLVHNAKSL